VSSPDKSIAFFGAEIFVFNSEFDSEMRIGPYRVIAGHALFQ
jgi:hypothetical protein